MPSVCTMDSDDDVNFANQSDSESDSEDNLMVSQELWSGFSVQAFSNQMDAIEELSGHEAVGSPSSHSLGSGSQSPLLTLGSRCVLLLFTVIYLVVASIFLMSLGPQGRPFPHSKFLLLKLSSIFANMRSL